MLADNLKQLRRRLHVSASSLKTFLQCPWKFRLRYVEGATPEFRSKALILGSAVHEALAEHHAALLAGHELPKADVIRRFDESVDGRIDGDVPIRLKRGEDLDTLSALGRALVSAYLASAQRGRIVAVEQPFEVPLIDPDTGQPVEPCLVGVFDAIEADDDGKVNVVELKTAARKWSDAQVELDLQGSLYAEAAIRCGLIPDDQEPVIRYEVLVKNKTPLLDCRKTSRSRSNRASALRVAVDVVRAIERDTYFRNPSWACATCEFRTRCGL